MAETSTVFDNGSDAMCRYIVLELGDDKSLAHAQASC